MPKSVHICGLFRQDLANISWGDLTFDGSEVWTLNDWYRCYPWMTPHRVFNVHFFPHVNEDEHRFPGDWKEWYNKVIARGGKISVVQTIEGVEEAGQELLPMEMEQTFRLSSMGCGISTAICLATHLGFEKITLHGVYLRDEEYAYQIQFIENALKNAVLKGVQIVNPRSREWEGRDVASVDWRDAVDADVGSLKHLVRYFKGHQLEDVD